MKVAVEWLRTFGEFSSLDDRQLADLLTMAGLEVEETHGEGSSLVYVTKVTPNRGDWLSIVGVAREAAAASQLPLKPIALSAAAPSADSIGDVTVHIQEPELCTRFGAAVVRNVRILSSPEFIQKRLILSGMRPVNVVVDITNYVMLELGQPMHAYDLSTLSGSRLIARRANVGEKIVTLDGVDHLLDDSFLLIADNARAVGIAGIMGGADTEVTSATTDILLEAAHFDPGTVRRGAKKLGYSTEASFRFERYVDPQLVPLALARAVELLEQYADASAEPLIIDNTAADPVPNTITLRTERVNSVLGLSLTPQEAADSLRRLGITVFIDDQVLSATVPTFRSDLVKEIDLIEEIGRMVGYWNLPETIPAVAGEGGSDLQPAEFDTRLRTLFIGQGLMETYSHTLGAESYFDSPESSARRVKVKSSLSSELSGLRLTLLPHLLDALALNLRHGILAVRLFEVGKTFYRAGGAFFEVRHAAGVLTGSGLDYRSAKGVVENLLLDLGLTDLQFTPDTVWGMHPGRTARVIVDGINIGYVAELDPYEVIEHLELPPSTGRIAAYELDTEILRSLAGKISARKYTPLPKYPAVSRDIALIFDLTVTYGEIEWLVAHSLVDLVESAALLSVYTGDKIPSGKKSVAIRLTLRSKSRTLTETDAEGALTAVRELLIKELGAEAR